MNGKLKFLSWALTEAPEQRRRECAVGETATSDDSSFGEDRGLGRAVLVVRRHVSLEVRIRT